MVFIATAGSRTFKKELHHQNVKLENRKLRHTDVRGIGFVHSYSSYDVSYTDRGAIFMARRQHLDSSIAYPKTLVTRCWAKQFKFSWRIFPVTNGLRGLSDNRMMSQEVVALQYKLFHWRHWCREPIAWIYMYGWWRRFRFTGFRSPKPFRTRAPKGYRMRNPFLSGMTIRLFKSESFAFIT